MRLIITTLLAILVGGCSGPGRSEASGPPDAVRSSASAAGEVLLVVNKSESTLSFIDPTTGEELARVPTGHAPHEVAVSPDGRRAYVTDYGTGPRAGTTLTVIDVPQRRVVRTVDLAPHTRPHGVVVAEDGTVWVTTEGSRHLLQVDPETGRIVQEIETGERVTHMVDLAPRLRTAITANIGSGTVTLVHMTDGRVLAQVPTGAGAEGLDVGPAGDVAYVTNREAGTLSEVDLETHEVRRSLEVGQFPIRVKVMPDGRHALVSNANANEVAVVDLAQWRVKRRIPVGAVPVGILITPDGRRAFVANTSADRVSVLDLERWEVTGAVDAGDEPDGMAWAAPR